MQTQRINISLPYDIVKHLNQTVSKGKRSRFIANAVSAKLAKRRDIQKELKKSLTANYEFYKKVDKDWEVTESEAGPQ